MKTPFYFSKKPYFATVAFFLSTALFVACSQDGKKKTNLQRSNSAERSRVLKPNAQKPADAQTQAQNQNQNQTPSQNQNQTQNQTPPAADEQKPALTDALTDALKVKCRITADKALKEEELKQPLCNSVVVVADKDGVIKWQGQGLHTLDNAPPIDLGKTTDEDVFGYSPATKEVTAIYVSAYNEDEDKKTLVLGYRLPHKRPEIDEAKGYKMIVKVVGVEKAVEMPTTELPIDTTLTEGDRPVLRLVEARSLTNVNFEIQIKYHLN